MSPITRSQSKKNNTITKVVTPTPKLNIVQQNAQTVNQVIEGKIYEDEFRNNIENLLKIQKNMIDKENKIRNALIIYKELETNLQQVYLQSPTRWGKFVSTVFNKCIEFENEYQRGDLNTVEDKQLVQNFVDCYRNVQKITMKIVKNHKGFIANEPHSTLALHTIKLMETNKPKRNIYRVDYTGMDSIEPEDEYDGITNIWADLTLEEDPDYKFEDEEEVYKENKHIQQQIQEFISTRPKRNIPRVNYSGMEDDEETY